jgi:phage terminase small subunit
MGRPPKPVEIKRATGRSAGRDTGGRQLPELSVVSVLPMADNTPEPPAMLGKDGVDLWNRAWDSAITWLSPQSDRDAIENAAKLADAVAASRTKYMATLEAADARAYVAINKAFTDSLASLGFDPVSRSRLGVAEVQRVSAIDKLLAKRQERQG